jgi:hypothetical protein
MQRVKPDDEARHAGFRPDPLIREPEWRRHYRKFIHAPTPPSSMILLVVLIVGGNGRLLPRYTRA